MTWTAGAETTLSGALEDVSSPSLEEEQSLVPEAGAVSWARAGGQAPPGFRPSTLHTGPDQVGSMAMGV